MTFSIGCFRLLPRSRWRLQCEELVRSYDQR
jgi:hypothetical protein